MSIYSRQDVLRILQISPRQLMSWERAGLLPVQDSYSFLDLGQLRTVRLLRAEAVPAASIRDSIVAMRAVGGLANPLLEASLVRTGTTRLAFRCQGTMVDPIRRQLLFDFERGEAGRVKPAHELSKQPGAGQGAHQLFYAAVQAEESGQKQQAIALYEQLLARDERYAPAYINLGTIFFHQRKFARAEELYRRAADADPNYVLAFFDLGNVLDELGRPEESIGAYRRAIELAPRYADAHYNLALAFERKGEPRSALRHWRAYAKLDRRGPWAEHARNQIRRLIDGEAMGIAWRAEHFVARGATAAALEVVPTCGAADGTCGATKARLSLA